MNKERRRLETELEAARRKGDPGWILLKREQMKLMQRERVVSFRERAGRGKVNYSQMWRERDETRLRRMAKRVYSLVTFPAGKVRVYLRGLNFPLIEVRSMYSAERAQSVKRWLKRPELGIKMRYVTERRRALEEFRDRP